ncbi:flagellar hook-length control protein FliK [Rhodoferax saidenbachensis]|nr:flagellar hook-length control protein FliK [Rhodoferax saidenbachensis]
MTIETGPAPTAPKAPTSEAGGAKGKTANNQNGGGAPGGFSAILEMVGTDTAPEVPSTADVATAEDPKADVPLDPAALLAQALQIQAPVSEESVGAQTPPSGAGGRFARRSPDAALAAGVTQAGDGDAAQGGATALLAGRSSGTAKGVPGAATPSASAASQGPADAKPQKFAGEMEAARVHLSAPEAQSVLPTILPGTDKPAREQSLFKNESTESKFSLSLGAAPTVETTSGVSAEGATSATMGVAEQVTYWISQDVQKAEMMLDGVGETPVEVSIRMSGNEAHVAFRTDESQTRDVLQNATAELKEMLGREGLMLAGVSVGASGTGDSGGQDRKSRQGAKQALVEVAQTPSVTSRGPGVGSSGRAVDLFV